MDNVRLNISELPSIYVHFLKPGDKYILFLEYINFDFSYIRKNSINNPIQFLLYTKLKIHHESYTFC